MHNYEPVHPDIRPQTILLLKNTKEVPATGKSPCMLAFYENYLPVPQAQRVSQHLGNPRGPLGEVAVIVHSRHLSV